MKRWGPKQMSVSNKLYLRHNLKLRMLILLNNWNNEQQVEYEYKQNTHDFILNTHILQQDICAQ